MHVKLTQITTLSQLITRSECPTARYFLLVIYCHFQSPPHIINLLKIQYRQQKRFEYRLLLISVSWDCEKADDVWAQDLFVASGDVRQKHRSMASCSKKLDSVADGKGADSSPSVEMQEFAQFSDKPQPPVTQSGMEDCTN